MTKPKLVLIPILAFALASCSAPLRTNGHVVISLQNPNAELARVAQASGIDLETRTSSENWYPRLRADQKASVSVQLYGADWGRELFFLSNEASLADSAKVWARAGFRKSEPRWFGTLAIGPKNGFIPTKAYAWGLFFNEKNLADCGGKPPESLAELEAMLARAKALGITPIALGASFGWPAAAWFTMLDIRMNGATAVRERYSGKRSWNDEGGIAVAARLAKWRDSGYFSAELASTGMPEAVASMESGRSLCTFMGAFAVERLQKVGSSRFLPFPALPGKGDRAEIAGLTGFALPRQGFLDESGKAQSPRAESAIALASAFIEAGSPDERMDPYRIPVAYAASKDYGLPRLQGIKATEIGMLKACDEVLPSFDQAMSPQALQNSIPLWSRFFSSDMKAKDFVDALEKAVEAGK